MKTIITKILTERERQEMLLWITKNIDIVKDSSDTYIDRWWVGDGWACMKLINTENGSGSAYELAIEDEFKAMEIALRWA